MTTHPLSPALTFHPVALFNSSFYIVTAVVLTLLWIAALLPGGPLKRGLSELQSGGKPGAATGREARVRGWAGLIAAVLSCIAFMLGEVCALLALGDSSASSFEHGGVLVSAIVLAVTAGLMVLLHLGLPPADGNTPPAG